MDKNDLTHLNTLWKDQRDFNLNFFPPTGSMFPEQSRQTKEMLIHMMSEMDELLRCTEWKSHRKMNPKPNQDQVKNELTDIFKYFISLCLIWDVSPKELIKDYWRKSMVCRQRYSEEFCQSLDKDIALIDIDGVLADYVKGILIWIKRNYPVLAKNVDRCRKESLWVDATSLRIDDQRFQEIKHHFRTSRGKADLPLVQNAQRFLRECKSKGLSVVLLTSRPIDKYPNIYTDTLEWLNKNELLFDYLWWAVDKKEAILSKNIRTKIKFAVDDDSKYVLQYSRMGITCYWVNWMKPKDRGRTSPENVKEVTGLQEILNDLEKFKGE